MAHLRMKVEGLEVKSTGSFSYSYAASSRSRPRRKCPGCGERGGISETTASTNGAPPQTTLACSRCGWTRPKGRR